MSRKKQAKDDDFDILGKLNSGQNMDLDLNDPKLMAELKEMGWDDEDEDMDFDPELAEMEKQLEMEIEQEEVRDVHTGKEMTAEEIENAKFDDDELNDPDLIAELEEAFDPDDDPIAQCMNRIEELKKGSEEEKAKALNEKQNGNREAAIEHLKSMKSMQAELVTAEALLVQLKMAEKQKGKKKDELEAPEDFDYSSIVSVMVLEFEKERATAKKQKDVLESIEMQIDIITNNIQYGILSQESYVESINSKISEYEELVKTGLATGFYSKHIEIMQKELESAAEMEGEEEEEEEEEETPPIPAAKESNRPQGNSARHEELMGNIKYRHLYEFYEEGKEAFQYLQNLGKAALAEKLYQKLESWQSLLESMRQGKDLKSEIKPLSPSELTGLSEENRRKELQKLIEFSVTQAAKYKEQALSALKEKDKDQAVVYKKDMISYETKAKQLEEAIKNPWQIPPKVSVRSIIKTVPQLNADLEPGTLEVTYGKASGLSDKEYYIVTYSLISGDTLTGTTEKFSKVCEKGLNHIFTIKIDPRSFANLYKKHIIFEVFEYHRLRSNKSQGTCNIKLEALAKSCSYQTSIQLSRKGPQIEVLFRIHKSLVTPETKQTTENIEYIEDLVAPFKSPDGEIIKKSSRITIEEKKVEETKSMTIETQDILEDEYDNPNVIRNLVSFNVLEYEIDRLKSMIIEIRSNGNNADRIIAFQRDLMRNKSIIEAQVANGMITPEQYSEVLEKQVQHDLKLAQFYKQKEKPEHLATVLNRIKTMKKEIQELASA